MKLVSDDYVTLSQSQNRILVNAPETIAGQIEVRGLGIYSVPCVNNVELVLIADLVDLGEIERYPDPLPHETFFGIALPVIRIAPFEASAAHKLLMALINGVPSVSE